MKVLFIHQNMPGQFKHLASWFGGHPDHQTVFVTQRKDRSIDGVQRVSYGVHRPPSPQTHHYLRRTEAAVLHGQAVVRELMELRKTSGFVPDLVIGHGGWGETLFVKDLYPRARVLTYCEFYYHGRGVDIGFDPNEQPDLDSIFRTRARNSHFLLALDGCDRGWSPTEWQKSVHPRPYHDKISVVHEGIDTEHLKPDPAASFTLPNGQVLRPGDEVVTYVARNLEPYRGFPTFMRSLPGILAARPKASVLVVGGEGVSYGDGPKDGASWREVMQREVEVDPARVHFLGNVPYTEFRKVLQVSAAHVYLTYPFVLSWSMLEAMSCGCLIVGSRTEPVIEVVEDGVNGLLVDFFRPQEVADKVITALADQGAMRAIRQRARETVLERYDLRHCFRQQMQILRDLTQQAL